MRQFCLYLRREDGATSVEYALIAVLISVVIVAGAGALGSAVNAKFSSSATAVASAQ